MLKTCDLVPLYKPACWMLANDGCESTHSHVTYPQPSQPLQVSGIVHCFFILFSLKVYIKTLFPSPDEIIQSTFFFEIKMTQSILYDVTLYYSAHSPRKIDVSNKINFYFVQNYGVAASVVIFLQCRGKVLLFLNMFFLVGHRSIWILLRACLRAC